MHLIQSWSGWGRYNLIILPEPQSSCALRMRCVLILNWDFGFWWTLNMWTHDFFGDKNHVQSWAVSRLRSLGVVFWHVRRISRRVDVYVDTDLYMFIPTVCTPNLYHAVWRPLSSFCVPFRLHGSRAISRRQKARSNSLSCRIFKKYWILTSPAFKTDHFRTAASAELPKHRHIETNGRICWTCKTYLQSALHLNTCCLEW